MEMKTEGAVRLTRIIRAPREAVFEAWTSAAHMRRWSCPDPTAEVEVDVDLRVGGAYRIRMGFEDGVHTAVGIYREIDPPRRVVYTWDWADGDHHMGVDTVVTVDFDEVDGGTRVRLLHEGFPVDEARAGHEEGWGLCLDRLVSLLG